MLQTRKYAASPRLILIVFFVLLFVFFLYTFLHEAGHALTGWFFGESLTEFNVNFWDFTAHVGMVGGELTRSQRTVVSAAGAGLPLLVWMVFISLVPRKASFILESLKLLSSMAVVNTLLAWIVLPILFIFGKAPSDDVTNFLRYSQMPPLLLTCAAVVLYVSCWILFLSRIDGLRGEFLLFRRTDRELLTGGLRTTIPIMLGIVVSCILVAFALNAFAAKNIPNTFSPPPDFEPIAQIDLSTQSYSAESLAQFSLEKSRYMGVFIVIKHINTTYFDLSLTGPDGYHSVILHGEGYAAEQDGGLWENKLPPGTYQVVLTSRQSPGTVSVFLKTH
jgi:hypothetical protein